MKRRILAIILLVVAIVLLLTVTVVEFVMNEVKDREEGLGETVGGELQGSVKLFVEAPRRISDG
ncbi:hypothetical protein HN935_00660 [archaeon]|jgi:hypothetical protein|nr:hypothetical protein [archaeon]